MSTYKNNKNYFSHDGNAHDDEKCISLKMKHGFEGYGIYRELIERLFNAGGKLMLSKCQAIAYQMNSKWQNFEEIYKTMISLGLLSEKSEDGTEENKYFYSKTLLERLEIREKIIEKRRASGRQGGIVKSSKCQANAKQIPSNKRKGKERIIEVKNLSVAGSGEDGKLKICANDESEKKGNNSEVDILKKEYGTTIDEFIQKRNSVTMIGTSAGFKKCLGRTADIDKARSKATKKYTKEQLVIGVNNYISEIRNRKQNAKDYFNHRFSLYQFLVQSNGLTLYVNM